MHRSPKRPTVGRGLGLRRYVSWGGLSFRGFRTATQPADIRRAVIAALTCGHGERCRLERTPTHWDGSAGAVGRGDRQTDVLVCKGQLETSLKVLPEDTGRDRVAQMPVVGVGASQH